MVKVRYLKINTFTQFFFSTLGSEYVDVISESAVFILWVHTLINFFCVCFYGLHVIAVCYLMSFHKFVL
jgi:hypothetical protein